MENQLTGLVMEGVAIVTGIPRCARNDGLCVMLNEVKQYWGVEMGNPSEGYNKRHMDSSAAPRNDS